MPKVTFLMSIVQCKLASFFYQERIDHHLRDYAFALDLLMLSFSLLICMSLDNLSGSLLHILDFAKHQKILLQNLLGAIPYWPIFFFTIKNQKLPNKKSDSALVGHR